jgi:hypothetical protein
MLCGILCGFVLALAGCGGGGEKKSTQELNDAQNKDQKKADADERALPRESKKK